MPTKGRGPVAFDDIVEQLVPDPASPRHTRCLFGYAGRSSREKHVRLYQNPSLSDFVDVPEDAVVHAVQVPASHSPIGGSYVWVRGDAELQPRLPAGYPPIPTLACPQPPYTATCPQPPITTDGCPIPSENLPCPPTPYPDGCLPPNWPPRTPAFLCPPPTPLHGCPVPTSPVYGCPPHTLSLTCPTRAICPPPTHTPYCPIRTRPIFCPIPQTITCPTPRTLACGYTPWGGGDPGWAAQAAGAHGFDPYATAGAMGFGW